MADEKEKFEEPVSENVGEPEAPKAQEKPSVGQKMKTFFVNAWNKVKGGCVTAWNKVKGGCVHAAKTVKGWFVKEKPAEVSEDGMVTLSPYQLSKKERFFRFCRSQSGWLFVLPAVILLCIFTLYPIVNAFIRAFMQNYTPTNKAHPYDGWGFENFVRVLKGDTGMGGANFWQCLLNTFIITIISVPLSIIIALLIAVGLNSIKRLQKAYQTILFLPYLTNALAMGAVFATFFQIIGTKSNPETVGIVNMVLGWFKISPIEWLKPNMHAWGSGTVKIYWASYLAAIIYEVWSGLPFKILILFSALQSVNKQYYDAARIDGASKTKILVKITAPMISPMLSYLFITGIMGGMKQYSSIVGLFGDQMGMDYNMGTVVGYIYQYIGRGQTGYAFAGSLLLFLIIMVITAINHFVSKKRVTYK
ncbi:MAG: sugar ABC transporter permease [Clostridia bacterium]|nr:sugar ABC transporter permease [Clostridia bacterium]